MSLFVDTSVWSLALRRNAPTPTGEVRELIRAIDADETLVTTGLSGLQPLSMMGLRTRTKTWMAGSNPAKVNGAGRGHATHPSPARTARFSGCSRI